MRWSLWQIEILLSNVYACLCYAHIQLYAWLSIDRTKYCQNCLRIMYQRRMQVEAKSWPNEFYSQSMIDENDW